MKRIRPSLTSHARRFWCLVLLPLAISLCPATAWGATPNVVSIPAGRFYTQAGGQDGLGFAITDGADGKFWTSYQQLGGVAALGYPSSVTYRRGGFTYQATQGALLQWRPELGRAVLANTFDQLSQSGLDDQLHQQRQIPLPVSDDGAGGDYARAVTIRLGWLTDPGIADHFRANPNPAAFPTWNIDESIQLYGLPMSQPESFGPFVSQRFQRITLQRWVQSVPGMPPPGEVVRVLGGDLAKEEGLVPTGAQRPRPEPIADQGTPDIIPDTGNSAPPPAIVSAPGRTIPAGAPINLFPLAPCRASAVDPKSNQNVPARAAPEAGTYQMYGETAVRLEHDNNCWSPSQLVTLGNHRTLSDITEVVIHWTGLDYQRSAYYLRRGVSVHWLVPRNPDPAQPPLELVDPRNAAWHAGPLNKGLWEDATHTVCQAGDCLPNGNVRSVGFENEGSDVPDDYQIGVMTDIVAGLIQEGYPIQLDRQHIVGHRDLNSHKLDPGNLDVDRFIALVRQKLQGASPVIQPVPSPSPAPLLSADGSAEHPFAFAGGANGQTAGSSGGVYVYYTIDRPSSQQLSLTFAYQGMAAPPGSVGVNVFQRSVKLGSASPAGGQNGGAQVSVPISQDVPVVLQVFSYIPQPVTYQMTSG